MIPSLDSARRRLLHVLVVACAAGASVAAFAADKQLRIGTLVPKNSLYHRQLMEIGEVWRTAQGGNARYLVYPDGSQGGEAEMARRVRIGQLQGALLSVVGLREIEPTVAALQNMPLLFRNWAEVDHVREARRAAQRGRRFRQLVAEARDRRRERAAREHLPAVDHVGRLGAPAAEALVRGGQRVPVARVE